VDIVHVKVLSHHLPGKTVENHEKIRVSGNHMSSKYKYRVLLLYQPVQPHRIMKICFNIL
jgi:hypothetical protein